MYQIQQLENQQWITKAQYSNRQAAFKRISQIRQRVIEMNDSSVEGPFFHLVTIRNNRLRIIA